MSYVADGYVVSDYVDEEDTGTADPAAVWSYMLPNGLTAGENLAGLYEMMREIWQEQGLDEANPLTVTAAGRAFGAIIQTITEVSGIVTVTRLP